MTTRQISRRKREEDDQDDEDIQFQYVSSHLSLMHSTNTFPLYSEEDRKRIMVDSDEEPATPSNSRDPNAMDDS